ncbi:MAG: glycosyltransferase family 1 protein [Bacteroidota bacterium]
MKKVFLEAHNIKNPYNGFGQFNFHLIKGLYNAEISDFKITLNVKDKSPLQAMYGNYFSYNKYTQRSRIPLFRVRKKFDVWHCLNQNIKVEPYHDLPYLLTVHDVNFVNEVSNDMNHKVNRRFQNKLNRSSAITYISEYAKASTHKYFKIPKVPEYVIYNGNPITSEIGIEKVIPFENERPYLFFIGGLTERKNVHTLVEMLEFLPDFDLILAGNTSDNYVEEVLKVKVEATKTSNRVKMVGKINEAEKYAYLKGCAAFVFPSLLEGFGIPPIEAMRFGKPVFLSNLTSLPEIGGDYAFYWDNFDPMEMAKVFEKGMSVYNKNKAHYIENYTLRARSFNWNDTAKRYAEVYRNLF